MYPQTIAVVGGGIAGLSAAWLLSKRHDVTLFEASDYIGGHTNTIDIETSDGTIAVDTGFIVYNPPNYPNLSALFDRLGVPTKPSSMTFAFSADGGRYEYSGTWLTGLIGQPNNLVSLSHWRMLSEISRFFRHAEQHAHGLADNVTLADYLQRFGYSKGFVDNHLLPMAAAIWSARAADMTDYPAKAFIRFFANHGLLRAVGRPFWRTVDSGAREYVRRIIADGHFRTVQSAPVKSIRRGSKGAEILAGNHESRTFDHVVIACHADQALDMLEQPTPDEQELLGAFEYSENLAVVHSDNGQMPKRKRLWSSWNYIHRSNGGEKPAVTYWMNSLQSLPCRQNIFVSLNPDREVSGEIARFVYTHPLFDPKALAAQRRLWDLQGEQRTWFCGSYFGAGFHEDALQSGLAVAEQLGGVRRPWSVADENARIHMSGQAEAMSVAAE